ncbi:MAG: response regulator [Planctomycetes bacterium]|nr:response regulator [Planctomycetota bacterium]
MTPDFEKNSNSSLWRTALFAVTVLAAFTFDLSIVLGVAGGVPYLFLVLISLWSPKTSTTWIAALIGTVLTVFGFLASAPGGEVWSNGLHLLLSVLAVWVTANLCVILKSKSARAALALAELKLAKESNEAKSQFLANMSHEIRTPMTAILGFADVLSRNVKNPENVEAVRIIQRNGAHLLGLINDILDLSKIEAGKLQVAKLECSPWQIVSEVASLMRVRANAKGLKLDVTCNGSLPARIQSDPVRIRQILVNLVGNAIKFTETGTVQIVTRMYYDQRDEPVLQFEVSDTGIGMTEEQIPQIFQPFTQADSSTHRQFGGTGLGLAICKRLTDLLGGTISVSSKPGKGTTFTISLPIGFLDGVEMLENPNESTTETIPEDIPPQEDVVTLNSRVLLAEDCPDNQRLISLLLNKAGADVTVAKNGKVALKLASEARSQGTPFDVILMDMQMPVQDGYTTTQKLRAEGYPGPIIALTANAMAGDQEKCIQAGCDDYMTKPVDRKRLIKMVEAFTNHNRKRESAFALSGH